MTPHAGAPLWAMTSYFNFMGYHRRRANYHVFRRRLGLPLVTVELACENAFELAPGDADLLIQLRCRDLMWQKERLLDIARRALPAACRQVVWLDCDIVFVRSDWADEASRALERVPVVQGYRRCLDLPRDAGPAESGVIPHFEHEEPSIACKVASGTAAPRDFDRSGHRHLDSAGVGLAWAARRDLLDRHGFYDVCVVGGGDRAFTCAIYGRFDDVVRAHRMSERRARHYRRWAEPVFRDVRGEVGFVDTDVMHLWHGDLEDRRVAERHQRLAAFGFDPEVDLAREDNGCWRWGSDKPAMHAYLRSYFASRREDG
jgi:hypothetical protein